MDAGKNLESIWNSPEEDKRNSEEDIQKPYSFLLVEVGRFCGDFGTNIIRNVTMYVHYFIGCIVLAPLMKAVYFYSSLKF